jgi:hypothetical protein
MYGELQFRLEIPRAAEDEKQQERKAAHGTLTAIIIVLAFAYMIADPSDLKIIPGTRLYFGAQTIGLIGQTMQIGLKAKAGSVLGISDITVTGSGFAVNPKDCTSRRESPQCMISVQFQPLTKGPQKAVLTIYRKGSSGSRQITLTGVGVPPPSPRPGSEKVLPKTILKPPTAPTVAGPISTPPPASPTLVGPVSTPSTGPTIGGPISTPPPASPTIVGPVSTPSIGPTIGDPVSTPSPLEANSRWADFRLFVSPADIVALQGGSGTGTIIVRPQHGFQGLVNLSVAGAPGGVSPSLSSASTTDTSTLTVSVAPLPPPSAEFAPLVKPGTYRLTITGSFGNLRHSTSVKLIVNASSPPDYALVVSPTNIAVLQGGRGSGTIIVRPQHGFQGRVNLSAAGVPSGLRAFFQPPSTAGTSTLVVAAAPQPVTTAEFVVPSVKPGTYSLTIIGTSGNLIRTVVVSLAVNQNGTSDGVVSNGGSWKRIKLKPVVPRRNVDQSPSSTSATGASAVPESRPFPATGGYKTNKSPVKVFSKPVGAGSQQINEKSRHMPAKTPPPN